MSELAVAENIDEEKISEHFRLVHFVIHKYNFKPPRGCGYDDLFQEGCIGLLDAVRRYKAEKGAFSTLAVSCIHGRICMFLRKQQRQLKLDCLSLESNDEQLNFLDLRDFSPQENVESVVLANELLRAAKEKYPELIVPVLDGLPQREIGKIMGISQTQVSRLIRKMREELRAEGWV